jgi:hypothetical protein
MGSVRTARPATTEGVVMGKAPSIDELAKSDSQFRGYLAQLEKELAEKSGAAQKQLQGEIDAFYKDSGFTDAQIVTSGQSYDFMQEQSFSLENLKTVIDSIAKAVFSGAEPPEGADVDKAAVDAATKALGPAIGEMANLELYIAGKVFDVLSNVLLSFGTSSEIKFSSTIESKPLGYGMQLFTAVSVDSYQSTAFFHNEFIYEYLYLYSVRFSLQQAKSEITRELVQLYEDQIVVFRHMEADLLAQLSSKKLTAVAYISAKAAYDQLIAETYAKSQQLKAAALLAAGR